MNKILRRISYTLGMCAMALTAVSCDDEAEELTSVEYDRLFAPTALEIRIQDRTNIRASWECLSADDAKSYTIELFANDPDMLCEGTPETYTDITENPYVITGLLRRHTGNLYGYYGKSLCNHRACWRNYLLVSHQGGR